MISAEDPSCYGCSQGWCVGHCPDCHCFEDSEAPDENCESEDCACHAEAFDYGLDGNG